MITSQLPPPAPEAHAHPASPLPNPNLTAALQLEYDALVSDLRRTQELCAEFQRQLASKSNEVDELKDLFAKTLTDLFRLQDSITELREERHRLANEAMRAAALTRKLVQVTAERDQLLAEIELSRRPSTGPLASGGTEPQSGGESGVKTVVSDMWRTLERLQTVLDPEGVSGKKAQAGFLATQFSALNNPPVPADSARS